MKKKIRRIRQCLSLVLTSALICSMLPVVPGSVEAKAENATVLYIKDTPGGDTETFTVDTVDAENGWSWNAETATLTLDGFNGAYVETNGDVNIVLVSDNTITLPAAPAESQVYGIKSSGEINITGDGEGEDTLSVTQTGFTKEDVYVTGICAYYDLTITDCQVAVRFAAATDANEVGYYRRTALTASNGTTYVTGNASLDIDMTETDHGVTGVERGLYAQTTGTIDINIYDANNGDDAVTGGDFIGVGGLKASGTGEVHLQVPNGNAIEGPFVVSEEAGAISFSGGIMVGSAQGSYMEQKGSFRVAPNKKITVAGDDTAKSGVMYKRFGGNDVGCYLLKEDGTKVTEGSIVTQADNPLVFADSPELDMSGLVVGNDYSGNYFHGLVFGGSGEYTFSIDQETPLPSGLELRVRDDATFRTAYIGGTLNGECAAGSFNLVVTDSASNTASITVNYDAVTDPPKAIIVDGTEFTTKEDRSGTRWNYTGSTKTLTLSGYDGGVIYSEEELNIVLTGNNTITLPVAPAESQVYGIKSSGEINITGDGEGEEDTLSIIQTGFTKEDVYVTGICAYNDLTITDCKVAVSFAAANDANEVGYYRRTAMMASNGTTYVTGNASLDIDMTETDHGVIGVERGLYAQTTGTIDINIYDANNEDGAVTGGDFIGVGGLKASGTGEVHLQVPNGNAIEGPFVVEEEAGAISFAGGIMVGSAQGSYMEQKGSFRVAPNKKITVAGDDTAKSGVMYKRFGGNDVGCYLLKEDGTKVIGGSIVTQADNPLVFADSPELDMSGLVVGNGYSGNYFHGLVFGGSGEYTFSIDPETPLPSGLELRVRDDTTFRTAYIGGTLNGECAAGSFNLVVSDSASNTVSITVNYDAVTVANPITGVSFAQSEVVFNIGDSQTLVPVITPDDASDKTVSWSSSADSVAYVNSNGLVRAATTGTANITATTKQGGFQAVCKVYVKEIKPAATVGETHLEGLVSDASYTVDGDSVTADASGKIEISDDWREKTIDIIKTNAEAKCNSDAQQLEIPAKGAVSIRTVSDLVTLSYAETTYDGAPKEPTVSIEDLVYGTDYTVAYENNVDAGNATVIISGTGNYYDSFSKTFKILPLQLSGITATAYSGTYDKMGHTFTVSGVPSGGVITYSLEEDGIYTDSKPTRSEAGETLVYFKVSLKNYEDYYGSTKITVLPISIANMTATLSQTSFVYDGKAKTPSVTVPELVAGTNYTVKYVGNVNAGTAKAVVEGKGNYGGIITKTFTITPASIAGKAVTLSQVSYTYDGTAKTPVVGVAGLKQGVDYTVSYANNVNVGTATVTVTGKGNYTGTLTKTFEIKENPAPAENTTIADVKTGITYKVTKSGENGGTVEFAAPKDKKVTRVTIPATVTIDGITYDVTSVAKNAFKGCSKLKSVTIGKNVKTIGTKAFYGCKKLKTITIKTTKLTSKTVGKNAFKGTPKNAKVKVPKKSLKAYKKFLYKKGLSKKAKIKK